LQNKKENGNRAKMPMPYMDSMKKESGMYIWGGWAWGDDTGEDVIVKESKVGILEVEGG